MGDEGSGVGGDPGPAPGSAAEAWRPMRSFVETFEAANHGLSLTSAGLQALLTGQQALISALNDATELREREAAVQAILGTVPEAVLVIDESDAIAAVNQAAEALFGYAAGELVGKAAATLLAEQEEDGDPAAVWIRNWCGTDSGRVTQARRKDGLVFPLELAVSEVPARDCPPCFVAFARDVTQRVRLAEELRQAHRLSAVGQITGGVVHGFNNLLAIALGNLEMLEGQLRGDRERELLREAGDAIQAGAELTGRLSAVARDRVPEPRPVRLQDKIGEIATLLRHSLDATVEIRTLLPDDLPMAMVDPDLLARAVLALALDARDAMARGGVFTIAADVVEADAQPVGPDGPRAGWRIRLSVSNTGAGTAAEERACGFDSSAGAGLGLATARELVGQSGGHIEVDGKAGRGTTVRLYLPQAQAPAGGAAGEPEPRLEELAGRGETILVVEDDPQIRRNAVQRLEDRGYLVLAAADGPAALRIVNGPERIDLLLSDIVMPGGLLGHELAATAARLRPGLRVVLTSASVDRRQLPHPLVARDHWLAKPYTALDLARVVRRTLDGASDDGVATGEHGSGPRPPHRLL